MYPLARSSVTHTVHRNAQGNVAILLLIAVLTLFTVMTTAWVTNARSMVPIHTHSHGLACAGCMVTDSVSYFTTPLHRRQGSGSHGSQSWYVGTMAT
jgi:hypothetical protein